MSKIGIIDFGYGNLGSLYNALSDIEFDTEISKSYKKLKNSDILFLPGIGSARTFKNKFKKSGLENFILDFIAKKKKIVAICLGFQFLFSYTDEDGGVEGLNIFPHNVKRISKKNYSSSRTGWFKVRDTQKIGLGTETGFFYFNHSYAVQLETNKNYEFGNSGRYLAWLKHENIIGFQFHPEKSQFNGRCVLKKIIT